MLAMEHVKRLSDAKPILAAAGLAALLVAVVGLAAIGAAPPLGAAAPLSAPNVTTLNVGTQPRNVAVNSTTHRAYVANYGSDTISVIQLKLPPAQSTVVATIP